MLRKSVLAVAMASVGITLFHPAPAQLSAQTSDAVALSGTVRSQEEGQMEGVVVSARRDGANFTVSVVSDAQGRYSFPRTHLEPGSYDMTARAVGYDLRSPGPVDVTADAPANADLQLRVTTDLASQLSSREWAMSFPGTKEQKDGVVYQLLSCAYCHTYQRIAGSRYTAEEFLPVINRMGTYYPDGAALSNDNRRGRALKNTQQAQRAFTSPPDWGFTPGIPKPELAEFFASVNLSGGRSTWDYELQTLPRPTGQATRVIITQYDMPTASTVSHDMDIDSKGNIWYTDESRQMIGKFEPATARFTEYEMPPVNEGDVPGTRDIQIDLNDNAWFPMRVPGSSTILTKFNPETEELSTVEDAGGQFLALGPDGKIWTGFTRVDPETMQVDARFNYQDFVPSGAAPYAGNSRVDSQGNAWMATNRGPGGVFGVNAETGEVSWFPVEGLSARRGRIDSEDRLWYAEYLNDKLFMFDTRTHEVQRWDVPEYSTPYAASAPDKNGYVYAPSNMSERFMRLDPRTGEIIEYQMPTEFDTKKIAYDPTTDRVVLWMTNKRTARITKVEPLD